MNLNTYAHITIATCKGNLSFTESKVKGFYFIYFNPKMHSNIVDAYTNPGSA